MPFLPPNQQHQSTEGNKDLGCRYRPINRYFYVTKFGTGLCSYRDRGVEGSCATHLTIEFYTVVTLLTLINITHHSFIPALKPSFSANPFHRSLPFLLKD